MIRRIPLSLLLGLALASEAIFLLWMAQHCDFLRAGEATKFTVLGISASVTYWLATIAFCKSPLTRLQKRRIFWVFAIVLRLAVLCALPGDDLWRYRWEGRIQLHGFNPYSLSPDAPALTPLRDADWGAINHRDHAAIYPPLAEMVFAGMEALHVGVAGYKILFLLADLGVAFVLRRLLTLESRSADPSAWYAWNPLAIYCAAGAAHFDVLMILCLLGAIWLLDRSRDEDRHADAFALGSTVFLGLSIGLKAVPLALMPVWFFALGWRRAIWTLPIGLATPLLAAIPYGFPSVPVFSGLGNFAHDFRVNDAIWWLVDAVRGRNLALNDLYPWTLVTVGVTIAIVFRRDWRRGTLWIMGAVLILSPVLHAWYVVWILPLAAWRAPFAQPWFVLSGSVFGYFLLWEVNHASNRSWEEPLWLRSLIFLPPLLALGWSLVLERKPSAGRLEGC